MRQPIKLIVKKGKVLNDGTRPVSLQYCHSATQRIVINSGIYIPPKYWNKKTGRISEDLPSKFGVVKELENWLLDKLRKAEDMLRYARQNKVKCPMTFLKTNLPLSDRWKIEQMKEDKKDLDVFNNIDQYVEERRSEVTNLLSKVSRIKDTATINQLAISSNFNKKQKGQPFQPASLLFKMFQLFIAL